jgi:hypothetical protein
MDIHIQEQLVCSRCGLVPCLFKHSEFLHEKHVNACLPFMPIFLVHEKHVNDSIPCLFKHSEKHSGTVLHE